MSKKPELEEIINVMASDEMEETMRKADEAADKISRLIIDKYLGGITNPSIKGMILQKISASLEEEFAKIMQQAAQELNDMMGADVVKELLSEFKECLASTGDDHANKD